jgi:hypothetical protein
MAGSPPWKVYSSSGEYRAAVRYVEDAAVLVVALGAGATIRHGHNVKDIVWREGDETQSASESYDVVRQTVEARRHGKAMHGGTPNYS